MSSNVLILGCGRSGTSIFGELFAKLPGYDYWSEPALTKLMSLKTVQKLAVKVPRSSAQWPSDPGLSIPVADLLDKMDNPKVYWIVRHPLDCLCSLRVGISRNWGHHPRPPDWQNWLHRSWIEQCAHHWCFINGLGYEQIEERAKVIYFENLILDTLGLVKDICADLSIEGSIGECQTWMNQVQNTNNKHFVEAETSRPYSTDDHEQRVGRWTENMTLQEADLAWSLVAKVAAQFGYQRNTPLSKESHLSP